MSTVYDLRRDFVTVEAQPPGYSETQIVAVILHDDSGARLAECADLAPEAFTDPACVQMWKAFRALKPGQNPGTALIGCGLSEPDIRRISEAEFSSINFRGYVAAVRCAWAERRAKLAAQAFLRGQITNAELAKEIVALGDVSRSRAEQLAELRFDPDVDPPAQRVIYRLGKAPICTAGNLANITAEAKAGKTAFAGAMIAAPMATNGADCLGVSATNEQGHALVHFDTETSRADWHSQLCKAKRRAGLQTFPPWIRSYHLTGRTPMQCCRDVEDALAEDAREFGKIFAVIIDGVGDLVVDPNDPEECFPLVTRMHELAIQYDTAIVNVLHRNPGTEKTRGHLGSQLERKAETNLTLEKDEDGNTVVYSLKQRGPSIPKADGARFCWSDAEGMHLSTESIREAKSKSQAEEFREFVDSEFSDGQAKHYRDVVSAIMRHFHCKDRKAGQILSSLRDLDMLSRDSRAFYHPRT